MSSSLRGFIRLRRRPRAQYATARCRPEAEADNRVVAEGEDGYFSGTTGLPVGLHNARQISFKILTGVLTLRYFSNNTLLLEVSDDRLAPRARSAAGRAEPPAFRAGRLHFVTFMQENVIISPPFSGRDRDFCVGSAESG
ncbi:MAG: hypothetical protein JRE24_08045 [Deltaproteobacteria bacterium]|nr:hypothetical protein [Deltaproteobacteria bacterium]